MKYNKKRVDIITTNIKNKVGRIASCEAAGISYKQFKIWYDTYPEFKDAVDEADEVQLNSGKDFAIKNMFALMPKNWMACAWWLERNFPKEYSKQEKIEMSHELKQLNIHVPDPETKLLMEEQIKKQLPNADNENI